MGRVSDAIAATRDGSLGALVDERREKQEAPRRNSLSISEAIEAVNDGTFDEKTRATADARASAAKTNPKALQRGRDLYEQFNQKGN